MDVPIFFVGAGTGRDSLAVLFDVLCLASSLFLPSSVSRSSCFAGDRVPSLFPRAVWEQCLVPCRRFLFLGCLFRGTLFLDDNIASLPPFFTNESVSVTFQAASHGTTVSISHNLAAIFKR